jgi:hypothetical protein
LPSSSQIPDFVHLAIVGIHDGPALVAIATGVEIPQDDEPDNGLVFVRPQTLRAGLRLALRIIRLGQPRDLAEELAALPLFSSTVFQVPVTVSAAAGPAPNIALARIRPASLFIDRSLGGIFDPPAPCYTTAGTDIGPWAYMVRPDACLMASRSADAPSLQRTGAGRVLCPRPPRPRRSAAPAPGEFAASVPASNPSRFDQGPERSPHARIVVNDRNQALENQALEMFVGTSHRTEL